MGVKPGFAGYKAPKYTPATADAIIQELNDLGDTFSAPSGSGTVSMESFDEWQTLKSINEKKGLTQEQLEQAVQLIKRRGRRVPPLRTV